MKIESNPALPASATLSTCDPGKMDWVPWAMSGAYFKLLHADPGAGRFSLMIKIDKGVTAPAHRHVGSVEGIVLEGGFHYHDQPEIRFTAGTYLFEDDGAVHQPVSPQGAVMFAVFHGAIEGLDDDGNVTGRVGLEWHVRTWNEAAKSKTAEQGSHRFGGRTL